jgi:hypothetical protein
MTAVQEDIRLADAFAEAERMATRFKDKLGIVGFGVVELRGPDGRLKRATPFANLITTAGDQYYAQKAIVGISPANPSAPTAMNGMKLGTGTTAAAKSGAGGALVTYLTASNIAFDSTYPQAAAVGGDTGWNAIYKTTWAAGVATNSAITEAVIVNDQATNATSTAANTAARVVFSAQNKGALDSLAITWSHKFLGA